VGKQTLLLVVLVTCAVASAAVPRPPSAHTLRKPPIPQQSGIRATPSLTRRPIIGRAPTTGAADAARSEGTASLRGVAGAHSAAAIGGAVSARGGAQVHSAAAVDGRTIRRRPPR
jgi:hypothetical protein